MADPKDNNPTGSAHGETDPASLPPLTTAPSTAPVDGVNGDEAPGEMDIANQSLADSLAVSFRVLRWLMLVILVLFVLSGFFTVQGNEVAVRTRFGQVVPGPNGAEVLTAEGGPYFRWPAPVGHVYRIPVTDQTVRIDEAFVFEAAKGRMSATPLSDIGAAATSLNPETDGSLLTGDGNLVHARYNVTYRIQPDRAAAFLANVVSGETLAEAEGNPRAIFEDAEEVVRAAVEAAIVADVAGKSFDEFYGLRAASVAAAVTAEPADAAAEEPAPTDEPGTEEAEPAQQTPAAEEPVEEQTAPEAPDVATPAVRPQDRVRVAAQQTLDDLQTGITIQEVQLVDRSVPPVVRPSVEQAFTAEQVAATRVSAAGQQAEAIYLEAMDRGYPAVLALVRIYEELERLREQRPEQFQAAQAALNAVFDGQPLADPLRQLASALPEDDPRQAELVAMANQYGTATIGGRAGTTVSTAQNRITQQLQDLEADASRFTDLLASYRRQPELVKQRLYLSMIRDVLGNPSAIKDTVPPNLRNLRVLLNEDQDIRRQIEQERRNQPNQQR